MDPMFKQILSFLETTDQKLTEIDLKSRHIVDEDVVVLVDAMQKGNNRVVTLNLINNHIGVVGVTALAALIQSYPWLTKLQLQLNDIGPNGAIVLAASLRNNRCRLRYLHLKSCRISASGAEALASALEADDCPLQDLRLDQNDLGDEGAFAMGRALCSSRNSCLYNLELKGNSISPAGAISIAQGLACSCSLESLGLSDNPIGDSGVTAIANALRTNDVLNWLFLSNTGAFGELETNSNVRNGVDALCTALYDDDSPERVMSSNHTLKEVYGIPSGRKTRLRRLLRFNKLGTPNARREKIDLFLSENPMYIQSSGVDLHLVPRILYKAGRSGALDTVYRHIRENPDILRNSDRDGCGVAAEISRSKRKKLQSWRRSYISTGESSKREPNATSFAHLDAGLLRNRGKSSS